MKITSNTFEWLVWDVLVTRRMWSQN